MVLYKVVVGFDNLIGRRPRKADEEVESGNWLRCSSDRRG